MTKSKKFYQLGNTVFRIQDVVGMQAGKSNDHTFPYKVIVYLCNDSLKTVGHGVKTKEEMETICCALVGFKF